jgi:hypothetical protein
MTSQHLDRNGESFIIEHPGLEETVDVGGNGVSGGRAAAADDDDDY